MVGYLVFFPLFFTIINCIIIDTGSFILMHAILEIEGRSGVCNVLRLWVHNSYED